MRVTLLLINIIQKTYSARPTLHTDTPIAVVKVRGPGGSAPLLPFEPPAIV